LKVSVILPTYNEKENVVELVVEIHKHLSQYDHEILVVDDNSPDGTYQALKDLKYPFVRAILRTEDRGFAKSIRCGLENATGDIFVVMDSDFNHQPKYLPFMIDSLKYYDCVTATRFQYGGRMGDREQSRELLSWWFNIFVRIMTWGQITDSLYGFYAVKRKILQLLNYDDIFWGYGDYCIRLFYYLQERRVNILQFPAVNGQRPYGNGNSNFLKVFIQYFEAVCKLAFRIRFQNKRIKAASPSKIEEIKVEGYQVESKWKE